MILLLSFFFLLLPHANAFSYANLTRAQYTPEQANQIINSTLTYVNRINQSAYLVFAPSLKQAYAYLSDAERLYNTSPATAVAYADLARLYASRQYAKIRSYAPIAIAATLILSAFFIFLLYRYMKPLKEGRKGSTERLRAKERG